MNMVSEVLMTKSGSEQQSDSVGIEPDHVDRICMRRLGVCRESSIYQAQSSFFLCLPKSVAATDGANCISRSALVYLQRSKPTGPRCAR